MNTHTTVAELETRLTATRDAALTQARHQLESLQDQWSTLSANFSMNLQQTWDTVRARIRLALDVPARHDIELLTARMDSMARMFGFGEHTPVGTLAHEGGEEPAATEAHHNGTEAHATTPAHKRKSRRS